MKRWVLLLFIFLIPFAQASLIEITDVKVYVDNILVEDADEDGGTIVAYSNSDIKFVAEVRNKENFTLFTTMRVMIDNFDEGDDYEKSTDFDLEANETRDKSIRFTVMSDTPTDVYDTQLRVSYLNDNATLSGYERADFELDIQGEVERDVEDVLNNITVAVENVTKAYTEQMSELLPFIRNLQQNFTYVDMYSNCEATKKVYQNESERLRSEVGIVSTKNEECSSLNKNCEADRDACYMDKKDMVLIEECDAKVQKEIDTTRNNVILIVVIGGAVGYAIWKQRKRGSVDEEYEDIEES